ncbi:hypothetical protein BFP97_19700 [Roseivirga sp. 4D4]|uniref:hypothetical protein n=1 Tax=Roseivirga sp. 4D4 TaxID=1889784 RepID=UPI0008532801|nr:hypothetical protein [Roseivirga sp. 4D4]OEK03604.1 hypothetical protein BFP97_19700 [Roseivirga sp. 4D4]
MKELFWTFLFFTFFQAHIDAQEFELGVYGPVYADPYFTYEFLEGNRFKYTGYGHLGTTYRGGGSYSFEQDSIYFHYESLKLDPAQLSAYSIDLDHQKSTVLLSLSLQVFVSSDSSSFPAAWIDINYEGTKASRILHTDENGKLSMLLFKPIKENILTVRAMGYRTLKIQLDTIKSASAKIRVYLKPANEFTIEDKISAYRFQVINDTSFTLAGKSIPKTLYHKQK